MSESANDEHPADGWDEQNVTRRTLIKAVFAGSGLAAVAGALYPLIRYLMPVASGQTGKKESFSIDANELHVGEARFFTFKRHPAVMVRKSEQVVAAMSAVCTHLGCIVKFNEQQQMLQCPCHGGKFDLSGRVVGGPPPKPLAQYAAKIEGGRIVVEDV